MSFFHNWMKFFSYEYQIKTAPEQAIIDELQALRAEVRSLRTGEPTDRRQQPIYDALIRMAQFDEDLKSKGY